MRRDGPPHKSEGDGSMALVNAATKRRRLQYEGLALTIQMLVRSAVVAAMGVATAVVAGSLASWTGDLGALLWVCACFFFPFVTGIAWGSGGLGTTGSAIGALVGGLVASMSIPILPHLAAHGADVVPLLIPGVFTPLGMAQGAIALPVGTTARKRRIRQSTGH